jgi:ABC-type multidrug transport system fused ATPase/permease subunit
MKKFSAKWYVYPIMKWTQFRTVKESILALCVSILSKRQKSKLLFLVFTQIAANVLDLVGIILVGLLGTLSINGLAAIEPGSRTGDILRFMGMEEISLQKQIAILGVVGAMVLISRTLLSLALMRRTINYLSEIGSEFATALISKFFSQNLSFINSKNSQDTLFALTRGVDSITVGILGASVSIVADFSLVIILTVALFLANPVVAICSTLIFGTFALVLYLILQKKAENLGTEFTRLTIESSTKTMETIDVFRELFVHGVRGNEIQKIQELRRKSTVVYSNISFLPSISKYGLEILIVGSTLFLSAVQFLLNDAPSAVGGLAIFLASSSRIAPAALRIQQSAIQIKSSTAPAFLAINLNNDLELLSNTNLEVKMIDHNYLDFVPSIEVSHVSFKYALKQANAVNDICLTIPKGSTVAIVGPSGSGKSTLVDLILGTIVPDVGSILISNHEPIEAIKRWPGAISYVPQKINLIKGTIRENVALGYKNQEISDQEILKALEEARLDSDISNLPHGINTHMGDGGVKLSGGQLQRIGFARALISKPRIIVLDEATSALDAKTEESLSKSIQNMRGKVTLIIVAHRLSTVKHADLVIYLDKGSVEAIGTFEELRTLIPEFDNQAKLLGL